MVDYISLIIPAFIGAIFAIFVNIIYYEYRFRKEKKLEFLKMQITDLLLPLYIFFYNIEKELSIKKVTKKEKNNSELIKYLTRIDTKNIPTDKLYLAGQKMSELLLDFIHYQYVIRQRENSYLWVTDKVVYENYNELLQTISEQYKQKVEEYQKKISR